MESGLSGSEAHNGSEPKGENVDPEENGGEFVEGEPQHQIDGDQPENNGQ